MTAGLLIYVFFLHFVADFLLQSREMGKTKSSNFKMLLAHLGIQFTVVAAGLDPVIGIKNAILISFFNALIHGVIDWHIWRGYKALVGMRVYDKDGNPWRSPEQGPMQHSLVSDKGVWQYWEDHWFYATIGLDQLLHMSTLVFLVSRFL